MYLCLFSIYWFFIVLLLHTFYDNYNYLEDDKNIAHGFTTKPQRSCNFLVVLVIIPVGEILSHLFHSGKKQLELKETKKFNFSDFLLSKHGFNRAI